MCQDKYSLHLDEQETILLYNRADGYWDVATSIPEHMNKFQKLGWKMTNDNGYEKSFEVPKKGIVFRDLIKMANRRPMSDEQKAANAARLKEMREKRQKTL